MTTVVELVTAPVVELVVVDGAVVDLTVSSPTVELDVQGAVLSTGGGGGGGVTQVFRSAYYVDVDISAFGGSITDGVMDIPAFSGAFLAGTRVMFDYSGLGADRGVWVAQGPAGEDTDGTFLFATEDQPYVDGNSGYIGSFGVDPITTQYKKGFFVNNGSPGSPAWTFVDLSYVVVGNPSDWADENPTTTAQAIDRLARVLVTLTGSPIPL